MLRCVVAGDRPLFESIAAERQAVLETMATLDQQEGMRAFPEKRTPCFNRTCR